MATTQIKAEQVKFVNGNLTTTTTQASRVYNPWGTAQTVTAKVAGTGAVSATVEIQVTNIPDPGSTDWITASSLSLSGTTTDVDGAAVNAAWAFYRFNVSAISGTGATVTVYLAGAGA